MGTESIDSILVNSDDTSLVIQMKTGSTETLSMKEIDSLYFKSSNVSEIPEIVTDFDGNVYIPI